VSWLQAYILSLTRYSTVSLENLQESFGEESIWVYNIIRVSWLRFG
jgi:hypothetical protein